MRPLHKMHKAADKTIASNAAVCGNKKRTHFNPIKHQTERKF